jgi:hypothetical protein
MLEHEAMAERGKKAYGSRDNTTLSDPVKVANDYKKYCKQWDLDPKDQENYHNFIAEEYPDLKDSMLMNREVMSRIY